ncbi:MAG: copper homeostasis protein CutC [Chitinophagia bacterium]|nr:copper homeostasis protein CutC [Chitinophagia bacterium]
MSYAADYLVEIATTDYETTRMAVEGGAHRIELCASLSEGGVTPSYGTIRQCRESFSVPLYPIIRPRGGDFLYSDQEFAIMQQDIFACKALQCDGVVIGLLQADGRIDQVRTAKLVELAYPMGVTFHRAFDRCLDPEQALEQLIAIGCERVLTSGQQPTAPEGAALIARMQQLASGRIVIMPGSGVRPENVVSLAKQTGCMEFHSSLRALASSKMQFVHPAFANSAESYQNPAIDSQKVAQFINALKGLLES